MQADGFHNPPFGKGGGGGGDSDSERSIKMNDRSFPLRNCTERRWTGSQSLATVELFTQISSTARLNLLFVPESVAAATTNSG